VKHRTLATALLAFILTGCGGHPAPVPAQPMQRSANAATTIGGMTLEVSTLDVATLNDTVAKRYGIDRRQAGALLLVTVRDPHGNGIEPGDLRLEAAASTLTDAPKPLPMRAITTDGLTDYIGVFNTASPATVQFRVNAIRHGARAEVTTTAELYPR
jgi:hypothetical protein